MLFQSLHSYKKPFEVSVPEDFFEKLQSMNFSKDDSSEKLGSLFRIRSFRGSGEGGRLPFSRVSMLSVSKSSLLSDLWSLHIGTFLVFFRLLLQLTQSQQTSFALERNLRTQQEIEDKMKGFSFKEDTLLWLAEVSISHRVYGN